MIIPWYEFFCCYFQIRFLIVWDEGLEVHLLHLLRELNRHVGVEGGPGLRLLPPFILLNKLVLLYVSILLMLIFLKVLLV